MRFLLAIVDGLKSQNNRDYRESKIIRARKIEAITRLETYARHTTLVRTHVGPDPIRTLSLSHSLSSFLSHYEEPRRFSLLTHDAATIRDRKERTKARARGRATLVLCVGKAGPRQRRGKGWRISSEDRVTHIVRGRRGQRRFCCFIRTCRRERSMVIKLCRGRSVRLFCLRAKEASKKCVVRGIKKSGPSGPVARGRWK